MKNAIVIVDHGSRLEAANSAVAAVAEAVRNARPDDHVVHAHLGHAEPSLPEAIAACAAAGATHVRVVPYFLAAGRHVVEDVPRLAHEAAEAHGLRVEICAPLGPDEKLVAIVLDRVGAD